MVYCLSGFQVDPYRWRRFVYGFYVMFPEHFANLSVVPLTEGKKPCLSWILVLFYCLNAFWIVYMLNLFFFNSSVTNLSSVCLYSVCLVTIGDCLYRTFVMVYILDFCTLCDGGCHSA